MDTPVLRAHSLNRFHQQMESQLSRQQDLEGSRCHLIPTPEVLPPHQWCAHLVAATRTVFTQQIHPYVTVPNLLPNSSEIQVSEVQEEFTLGLSLELARSRGADRVAGSSKKTLDALTAGLSTAQSRVRAFMALKGVGQPRVLDLLATVEMFDCMEVSGG